MQEYTYAFQHLTTNTHTTVASYLFKIRNINSKLHLFKSLIFTQEDTDHYYSIMELHSLEVSVLGWVGSS